MRRLYPAVIHRERRRYGISFPDFPGCVSAANSLEAVIAEGAEALSGHIALMVADGDPLPDATPAERVAARLRAEGGVAVALVPVVIPGRAKRINVTLDESLIAEIDHASDNRSGFLASAARAELARRRGAA